MPEPGQNLSHYRLIEKIGEGGMGVVWKAEDTTLDREVAIKVLPSAFADDAERLARFEREAKLLAALSHPNIAAIHGLDQDGPTRFLAMELVAGEDLASRISRGALPVEESIEIAKQIAAGLEAAHCKGVVHRDLKPANVRLMPDGTVKILDFGLAKALVPAEAPGGSEGEPTQSPTVTSLGSTVAGVILGTAAYMSPEQARGQATDRRADVWAFGCVLYEMLTGIKPFAGPTVSDSLALVLARDPDWEVLPSGTPARVRVLLERSLKKDRAKRLRDIGDASLELETAVDAPVEEASVTGAGRGRLILALFAGGVLGAALTALILPRGDMGRPGTLRVGSQSSIAVRSLLELSNDAPLASAQLSPFGNLRPSIAVSRDGEQFVYVADVGGETQLFLRRLDEARPRPLAGTRGAFDPFFSPDGSWLAYFTKDKLHRLAIDGGAPETLCDASSPAGGAWSDDDTIYFSENEGVSLSRVPAAGGTVQQITCRTCPEVDRRYFYPEVLPGGDALIWLSGRPGWPTTKDDYHLAIYSLSGDTETILSERGYNARYVPSGHLLFVRAGGLMAVPFDAERHAVTGPAFAVVDGVMSTSMRNSSAQYAVSSSGLLTWVPGGDVAVSAPVWVDRAGNVEALPISADRFGAFRLSPDGQRLAIEVAAVNNDIRIYDLQTGRRGRLTLEGDNVDPYWTPDGEHVAFSSHREGGSGSYWKRADGAGEARRIRIGLYASEWLLDGRHMVVTDDDLNVGLLEIAQAGAASADVEHVAKDIFLFRLSPDQRWLAYTSSKTGEYEVFVQAFPEPNTVWQVSNGGGEEPVWAPDGSELYYRSGSRWMVVSVRGQSELQLGAPDLLFEGPFRNPGGHSYDVDPNGDRFLMLLSKNQETTTTRIPMILNAFELLRGR